jgi:hypothetical protein
MVRFHPQLWLVEATNLKIKAMDGTFESAVHGFKKNTRGFENFLLCFFKKHVRFL